MDEEKFFKLIKQKLTQYLNYNTKREYEKEAVRILINNKLLSWLNTNDFKRMYKFFSFKVEFH